MTRTLLAELLQKYLPAGTEQRCAQWLYEHRIQLRISRPRKTRLGDFRPAMGAAEAHRISVNSDLVREKFLITLVHEIAHAVCWNRHGRKVRPHGREWKSIYSSLLRDILALNVLDSQTQDAVYQHSLKPAASSSSDVHLQRLTQPGNGKTLNDLKPGAEFGIEDGRRFISVKKLRTYWLCKELSSDKHYKIRGTVSVSAL